MENYDYPYRVSIPVVNPMRRVSQPSVRSHLHLCGDCVASPATLNIVKLIAVL